MSPLIRRQFLILPSPGLQSSRTGYSVLPRSVRLYSTLGGTSGCTVLWTSPCSSMLRSFSVRTFCDIPVTDFWSSPNLFVPVLRSLSMRTTHLSLIRSSVVSTGHEGDR